MNITQAMQTRYATKAFDPNRTIPEQDMTSLLDVMRFAPSSVNVQPWHFIVASTDVGKARVNQGAQGPYAYNAPKVQNASHVVVVCSKIHMDDDYLLSLLEREEQDGRFAKDPSFKQTYHGIRSTFVNLHRYQLKDTQHWMEKQTYLNIGAVLTAAAAMGIDALPMEGFDFPSLDKEFDLPAQNLSAICVIALGYRAESDFNAGLPKSRWTIADIVTEV